MQLRYFLFSNKQTPKKKNFLSALTIKNQRILQSQWKNDTRHAIGSMVVSEPIDIDPGDLNKWKFGGKLFKMLRISDHLSGKDQQIAKNDFYTEILV